MPPDTETPTPLAIPDAAADAFFACGCQKPDCFREGYRVEAIPLILAAELRRMASQIEGEVAEAAAAFGPDEADIGAHDAIAALRARADQLDPKEA